MKTLIAGYGSIGRRHFNNLKALGEEDILFFRSGKGQFESAELQGHIVETDIESALKHKPDAVIVSNPTALHLEIALPAAKQGCHILLEKPISHSMEGIAELQSAVEESGSQILVGFQFRYHPGLLKMREIVDTGKMGEPLFGRAHWGEYLPDWHPYEDYRKGYSARNDLGGGAVLTLCHPFDYLRWIFGEIIKLSAITGQSDSLEIDVEDNAEAFLDFAEGAKMNVHLDYLEKPGSHSIDLVLSEGMLRWDAKEAKLDIYSSQEQGWQKQGIEGAFERNDVFLDMMKHFIQVVEEGEEPACTLDDGIAALEIALAVLQSAKEGKELVFNG